MKAIHIPTNPNGNPGDPIYTGLTSGTDGYLTKDGSTHIQLLAGTYYLVETQAATGYMKLSEPVKFTISRGGRFTARSADQEFTDYTYASTVTEGETSYPLLKVPNKKKVPVSIWKTDVDKHTITSGATFELYKADDYDDETQTPIGEERIVISGTTRSDGILALGELEVGEYRLVETAAPAGYDNPEHAIKIFVTIDGVSAMQETGYSDVCYEGEENWVSGQEEGTAQIRVWNNPGAALPSTGGPGTRLFTILGSLLLAFSFLLSLWRQYLIGGCEKGTEILFHSPFLRAVRKRLPPKGGSVIHGMKSMGDGGFG